MNSDSNLCPVCGVGTLDHRIEERTLECNGHKDTVPMHYSVCDDCGSEIGDADDMRKNREHMREFRRKYEQR